MTTHPFPKYGDVLRAGGLAEYLGRQRKDEADARRMAERVNRKIKKMATIVAKAQGKA